MKALPIISGLIITATLAACISTNDTMLAPNVARIDTHASGLLFTGKTSDATLLEAAKLTLSHGYAYFRFADAQTGSGSRFAGIYSSGSANAYGHSIYGSTFSTPVFSPTSQESVTVLMFNDAQPGAWNASEVLAKNGKM